VRSRRLSLLTHLRSSAATGDEVSHVVSIPLVYRLRLPALSGFVTLDALMPCDRACAYYS
jgi:hypothetical protein